MSILTPIVRGSLLSRERLLQAREFYAPVKAQLPAEMAFARWTQRIAVQTELGGARELAGLTDEELAALEAEFLRCPNRARTDGARHAVPIGAALLFAGVAGLAWQGLAASGGNAYSMGQLVSVGCLLAGAFALAVGLMGAFGTMHLELSHGTTGLYVGQLDEQHPWLYRAVSLASNPVAEEYRQGVLRSRGPLRGVDCVMMAEVVRAHDAAMQTRPARALAQRVQLQTALVDRRAVEPRLVAVASRLEPRTVSKDREPATGSRAEG